MTIKDCIASITPEIINKYIKRFPPGPWCNLKSKKYPANSPSRKEGRYNDEGEPAFYAASGHMCAEIEVGEIDDRVLYHVSPEEEIMAFNINAYAQDYGIDIAEFTKLKSEGGWQCCQEFAKTISSLSPSLSAICYPSAKLAEIGQEGCCMVLWPLGDQEIPEAFFKEAIQRSPDNSANNQSPETRQD